MERLSSGGNVTTMLSALVVASLLSTDPLPPPPSGAVAAPAVLPAGSLALYGVVGAPDLGVGFRQGFAPLEFEARASFNLFEVSVLAEAGVKFAVFSRDALLVGVGGAFGINFDSGAKYFDKANYASIFLRPRVSGLASYKFSDFISGLAQVDVPLAFSLSQVGQKFTPTLGAGVELQLGSNLSLLALGAIGVDVTKEALGVTQVRAAWAVRLGVGWRLF